MKNPLIQKTLSLVAVLILLLIIIQLIGNKIDERSAYRDHAKQRVSNSWTGAQSISLPVLVAKYQTSRVERKYDDAAKQFVDKVVNTEKEILLLSDKTQVSAQIDNSKRDVGIYSVPVYQSELVMNGQFNLSQLQDIETKGDFVKWTSLQLTLSVTDLRGVVTVPSLVWGESDYQFSSGLNASYLNKGMHVSLPLTAIEQVVSDYSLQLSLRGSSEFAILPLSQQTEVTLISNWPHPKFVGQFLPSEREVSHQGYQGSWMLSSFSSDVEQQLAHCFVDGDCHQFDYDHIGVEHIEPIDIYTLSDRAIKYAVLFVLLTLIAFVVFEFVKQLPIHPVQYAMIGLALTIFYLLLISLSEHMAFELAYGLAALACALVLWFYLAAVLSSNKLAAVFSAYIASLYATLFFIIQSEDAAFVFGSLLCFAALSVLMMATRKVDWYQYSLPKQTESQSE